MKKEEYNMHNDKLKYVLKTTKLDKCEVIIDNYLYYIKKIMY